MPRQIPPLNYGMVEEGLHRFAIPNQLNFPFLEQLGLRTIINLSPEDVPGVVATWMDDANVQCFQLGKTTPAQAPWKPASEDVILAGLHVLLEPANYPIGIMCTLGRHHTGTLVGCLRKLQGWNLTAILEEYRRHAGSKRRLLNEQFIELFDVDLVQLPGAQSRPKIFFRDGPRGETVESVPGAPPHPANMTSG